MFTFLIDGRIIRIHAKSLKMSNMKISNQIVYLMQVAKRRMMQKANGIRLLAGVLRDAATESIALSRKARGSLKERYELHRCLPL